MALIDLIKYNGGEHELVWKYKSDQISIGTQLLVHQSQEAVFAKDRAFADVFGPGSHTLSANNIPLLKKLINLPFGGETPFAAEVWFVDKVVRRNLKFGTVEPIPLEDPTYGVTIPVRAFGTYGVQVTDSSAFLAQMVGTQGLYTTEQIIAQFCGKVVQELTAAISALVIRQGISITKINGYIKDIQKEAEAGIFEEFSKYGVLITNFDIMSLNFDRDDPHVKTMLEAQAERSRQAMSGQGEAARLAALSNQTDMFKLDRQLDILQTAAGNEGGAGQMMGAGMGLGMGLGVGGAFGQQMGNIAGVMNPQATQPQQSSAPPPPPMPVAYHVMVNNVQQGPYDVPVLQQMVQSGQITRESYVWKTGMAQWAKAGDCTDLQHLFAAVPPPPPPMV